MTTSKRGRDLAWAPLNESGDAAIWDQVIVAVLLDIRDRLDVLRCQNFIAIPARLAAIDRNTRKPRKKRKVTR